MAACQLTHIAREPIDLHRAQAQHAAYERAVEALGFTVHQLPPDPILPDSVFVEDTAIVLDELAVITRPGAPSRRAETPDIARALAPYRPLRHIDAPGTLEGGDVLCAGRTLFVGRSRRTNDAGIQQLRSHVRPFDYAVRVVDVDRCLHLKSAVTQVSDTAMLVNPAWIDARHFAGWHLIDVDPAEPFGANALLARGVVLYPQAFPATRRRLEAAGVELRVLDVSEMAKAEGGLTCCSLLLGVPSPIPVSAAAAIPDAKVEPHDGGTVP